MREARLRLRAPRAPWLHTVVTIPLMCVSSRSRHTGQAGSSCGRRVSEAGARAGARAVWPAGGGAGAQVYSTLFTNSR